MSIFNKARLLAAVLLISSLACSMSSIFPSDTNAISTAVAQTVIARITQDALQATLLPPTVEATFTSTSTFTFTPEPPTLTPTITSTPTLPFTPTREIPFITVSMDTNCRNGPGKVYEMVGALLVGEVTQIFGRDPTSNYWYIRNPDGDPEFCWVWGKYATLIGPALLVPAFTPPPTPTATATSLPTPKFSAEYTSLDSCNGYWWAEIKLKNIGGISFKSVNISVKDKITDVVVVNIADGFINLDNCLTKSTKDILGPGDTYITSSPAFNYNPESHKLIMTITLCSETGQKGSCTTERIEFEP